MNKQIFLLIDYRRHFYSSVRYKGAGQDIHLLSKTFAELGYELIIREFSEIDFRKDNFNGCFVLYQSSEDRGLLYKSFIEDVILGCQFQGAILIPNFYLFRAHHNKVFMEIMRDLSPLDAAKTITSKGYGTLEEYLKDILHYSMPIVLKASDNTNSKEVQKFDGGPSSINFAKKISRSMHFVDALKDLAKSYLRSSYYTRQSNSRRKFIVQNYVSDLAGDYKILVYGEKVYVLKRCNRPNDFRASGSGLFEWVDEVPDGLLDFAWAFFESLHIPFVSLDVGMKDSDIYLFEFQGLHFGTTTLERSKHFFMRDKDNLWVRVVQTSLLEMEVAHSVVRYINLIRSTN